MRNKPRFHPLARPEIRCCVPRVWRCTHLRYVPIQTRRLRVVRKCSQSFRSATCELRAYVLYLLVHRSKLESACFEMTVKIFLTYICFYSRYVRSYECSNCNDGHLAEARHCGEPWYVLFFCLVVVHAFLQMRFIHNLQLSR